MNIIYLSVFLGLILVLLLFYVYFLRKKHRATIASLEDTLQSKIDQLVDNSEELRRRFQELQAKNTELERQRGDTIIKNLELEKQKERILAQAQALEEVNIELNRKHKEIQSQKEEMLQAYDTIQRSNKRLLDAMRYAQTIQKSILPDNVEVQKLFAEHFIIYQPKDIVSGDFYWLGHFSEDMRQQLNKKKEEESKEVAEMISELNQENESNDFLSQSKKKRSNKAITILAVVDCTGHGVPGAFMSMIGDTLLNEIIKQRHLFEPARILEMLNLRIKDSLTGSQNEDGMDVCICTFEKLNEKETKVVFAGAKRPIFYKTQGKNLQEIKGVRRSIGGWQRKKKPFKNEEIVLAKNTMLYLTSDGYVSQVNKDGKRLGTSKLITVLDEIAELPVSKQKEYLENSLEEYKEHSEQRDDITVLGVRI